MQKKTLIIALALTLSLLLTACGDRPQEQANDGQAANEAYIAVIAQAPDYFPAYEGDDQPQIAYSYALIQMQQNGEIPALALREEIVSYVTGDMASIILFQYAPAKKAAIQLEDQLSEGVAGVGGYRGWLAACAEGPGILAASLSSGTGNGSIVKYTLAAGELQKETLFEGFMFDDSAPTIAEEAIQWYADDDLSPLDGSEPPKNPEPPESADPLAAFAGTYTAYEEFHDGYGGGERLQDITLTASGMVTGGGTSWMFIIGNGLEPAAITQLDNGAYEISYPDCDAIYTVYPAGVVPEGYDSDYWQSKLDRSKIHLRYLFIDGGVMDVLYHN